MSSYPGSLDGPSTLFIPVDAFSTKPLQTTATAAIGAGDSTISVLSTAGGFADAYGILSIDDELVVYTAKTGAQFTGCQRGAFGTTAASHANGVAVKANMVAGFITAVQSAVLAIENELGSAAARNYVRKDGAVTVTGIKTFQDGAEFGSGTKAGTGLVRLPNTGAIKWRKADNSGDLGLALNASNHLALDAIIDFAPGQTFGAFSYPDATTTSKGIIQVDPVGGLAIDSGVVSLGVTGVAAGTYTKITVDTRGRATAGASLAAADLPQHSHVAGDIVSGALPFTIQKAGAAIGTRRALNLVEGANVTLAVVDDSGNDRVNVTVAASTPTHNLLSAMHPDTVAAAPVLGDMVSANGTPAWARLAGNSTTTRKFLRQVGTGSASALPAWDTLVAGDLPAHTHVEADVTNLATDLANRPVKGAAWAVSKTAVINASGQLDAAAGTATDCVLVNGGSAAKANAVHTHAAADISSGAVAVARGGTGADLSATGPGFLKQASAGAAVTVAALAVGDLPAHTHTSSEISDATANATASTVVLRDGSGGANFGYVAANNLWAYLDSHVQSIECGAFQTVGAPFENMAKYSEDFSVATWDKNGGSCTVSVNATTAPDGNATADQVSASTTTPVLQQQVAGLVSGGQYTFYVWARVASGTRKVSIAIVDNAYATYLAGPTQVALSASWLRFKITGTLAAGQTGLWIVVRQYAGNGDDWTTGSIFLWGACLQQGNDPKKGYARTWASQTASVAAGIASGAVVISAKDNAESPLRIYGPGSNLADHRLLEVTAGGELILAGGTGNGYRLAELMGASNPSGWSGVIKVKNPAGVTAGYILLYSNP